MASGVIAGCEAYRLQGSSRAMTANDWRNLRAGRTAAVAKAPEHIATCLHRHATGPSWTAHRLVHGQPGQRQARQNVSERQMAFDPWLCFLSILTQLPRMNSVPNRNKQIMQLCLVNSCDVKGGGAVQDKSARRRSPCVGRDRCAQQSFSGRSRHRAEHPACVTGGDDID